MGTRASEIGSALLAAVISIPIISAAPPPPKHFALESADGLHLYNVAAEPAMLQDKKGVRITVNDEGNRKLQSAGDQSHLPLLAAIDGVEFANGTIEAEIAGAPAPGVGDFARGFVGIAFRIQPDAQGYDAFYLRPTNGRADDQERRNHSAQYISHPDWTWFRLRKETPSKYEAYVDLQPAQWTKVKIDVRGDHARLFVGDRDQPTLLVNDVKTGAQGKGGVGLWIGPGTIAHFRNLTVTPAE